MTTPPVPVPVNEYGRTLFLGTGCCNLYPTTDATGSNSITLEDDWRTQSPVTVFYDMYAYCTLVRDGSATETQEQYCGCAEPHTACTQQTMSPRDPVTSIPQRWHHERRRALRQLSHVTLVPRRLRAFRLGKGAWRTEKGACGPWRGLAAARSGSGANALCAGGLSQNYARGSAALE